MVIYPAAEIYNPCIKINTNKNPNQIDWDFKYYFVKYIFLREYKS